MKIVYILLSISLLGISCSKEVSQLNNVEIVSLIIEKVPNEGDVNTSINFAIYDDIGLSYYSKYKSLELPLRYDVGYVVPNFQNQYSICISANDTTAIYFQVNFSLLKEKPPVYIYETPTQKVLLTLKWIR